MQILFRRTLQLGLIWLSIFFSTGSFSAPLPLEHFTKASIFNNILLSPDGKFFAASVPKENTTALVVIDRNKMKIVKAFGFGRDEHVGVFSWANNSRLIYTKVYQLDDQERKSNRGEIFAVNIDGSAHMQIFGYSDNKSKNKQKKGLKAHAKILNLLPNDPKHVLLLTRKWQSDHDDPMKLFKVNIYNKKRTLINKTPLGNMKIVTNGQGDLVIASGKDRNGKKVKYLFKQNQWQEINKDEPLIRYTPISVNRDGTKLYLTKTKAKGGTQALYQYNFKSKEILLLFNHPIVDIKSYIRAPGSREIIAVKTMLDGIDYHYIDHQHPFTKVHQQLAATFPEYDINVAGNSLQDNEFVISIKSDKNPGEFYLFNQKAQTVDHLISRKGWLNEADMMPRKLIQFRARDNQTIYGYLTLPKATGKPHPLIVDVHGGPFGVQDAWHFNTDAQMFANNGYAVLQVNFRGSGGYGKTYKESAYLKRNSLIQHDIIDGTRWALGLDNIDDEKVCIVGGSFGGYSALMAPLLEPTLYKCAIPRYGPYDLVYQMTHADYMSKDSVSVGAKKKYGDNEQIWLEQSPLTYIDKLQTPLLIVTGGKDRRVPPQSALNLKKALDDRKINYHWLYKEKEGHGFTNPENKLELFEKSLKFIDRYIQQ